MSQTKLQLGERNKVNWLASATGGHTVQFYRSDQALISLLTKYVHHGITSGETCLVIATATHLQYLNQQLAKLDIDIPIAQACGQYITLDATETLDRFMVNDLPDRDRFTAVIGGLVKNYAQQGQLIRAYGEMVAVLWQAGNKAAVIMLENLWNELAQSYVFSLYCGYPEELFATSKDELQSISNCHQICQPQLSVV